MFVYKYYFIDDPSFIKKPTFEMGPLGITHGKYQEAVKAMLSAGWEGDRELGIIWLPPFLFNDCDTFGLYVWHVRQANNGTSFIASDYPLHFKGLEA